MRIAFGPVSKRLSWTWVGHDIAKWLEPHLKSLSFFGDDWAINPTADTVVIVKRVPPDRVLHTIRQKIVYQPIDPMAIPKDFLQACALTLVHCERLIPLVRPHCRVEFVEHYNLYAVDPMSTYKTEGPALWMGVRNNYAPLLGWLEQHPSPYPLTILMNEAPARLPGQATFIQWSEETQRQAMKDARLAIDVKGQDFTQQHKPPTKAQQFLMAGLPFGVNRSSYSHEYFARRGLDLAEPHEERLGSHSYWQACQAMGRELRERLTLANVGTRYLDLLRSL